MKFSLNQKIYFPTNDPKIININIFKISDNKDKNSREKKDFMNKKFSKMIDIQKEEYIKKINKTQNLMSGEKSLNDIVYQKVENFNFLEKKEILTSTQKTDNLCNYLENLKLKNYSSLKEDEIKIENFLGVKRKNGMLNDINSILFNLDYEIENNNVISFPSKKLKS
jgi:hypothetical protein